MNFLPKSHFLTGVYSHHHYVSMPIIPLKTVGLIQEKIFLFPKNKENTRMEAQCCIADHGKIQRQGHAASQTPVISGPKGRALCCLPGGGSPNDCPRSPGGAGTAVPRRCFSKHCLGTPDRSLSLFQGVHEVRAVFILILWCYSHVQLYCLMSMQRSFPEVGHMPL